MILSPFPSMFPSVIVVFEPVFQYKNSCRLNFTDEPGGRCVVMEGPQMQYRPTVAVSMATLRPSNTATPVNILTKGEGGGRQSG